MVDLQFEWRIVGFRLRWLYRVKVESESYHARLKVCFVATNLE